jgi:predicted dehydrogenase
MTQTKLRVGVIGVGYLGRFHAEKYAAMEGVELIGVADLDRERAETVAGKVNSRAYTRHERLLGEVDAVSVAVPTSAHFQVAMDFISGGSDVLIEKPMATNLDEADRLIRHAAQNGRMIQVGHLERFNPAVVAARRIVDRPLFIEAHRLGLFSQRGTDVSVVLDLMIHDIDLVLSWVTSELVELRASGVTALTGQADVANARLEFDDGRVACLTASRISGESLRKLRFFQEDGCIAVDLVNRRILRTGREPGPYAGQIPDMRIDESEVAPGDALKDEIAAFVSAVAERRLPAVTGQMGRDALRVALQIDGQIRSANRRIRG